VNPPTDDPRTIAGKLRQSFDETFTAPRAPARTDAANLLLVRAAGHRYGIRIDQLRGLIRGRKVTPLPGAEPTLLGIVGIRGQLVPAFDLAALIGHAGGPEGRQWLAVCDGPAGTIALAFDESEGTVRIPRADLYAPEPGTGDRPTCSDEVARLPSGTVHVIDVESVAREVARRTRGARDILATV
jgi:chemotaxis signal transduction protein